MSAYTDATQLVNKICCQCGCEFWIDCYLAPKLAFDRCDDCTPALVKQRRQGAVLIASSDDPPGTTRVKFTFDALKPERRLGVARALSAIVLSLIEHEKDSAPPASAETGAEMASAA